MHSKNRDMMFVLYTFEQDEACFPDLQKNLRIVVLPSPFLRPESWQNLFK